MRFSRNINIYAVISILICLFLVTSNSVVMGARLSGDEGVTTVSPQGNLPPKKEVTVRPEKTEKKVNRQEKVKQKKKVTGEGKTKKEGD
jgi:hypothetical protein